MHFRAVKHQATAYLVLFCSSQGILQTVLHTQIFCILVHYHSAVHQDFPFWFRLCLPRAHSSAKQHQLACNMVHLFLAVHRDKKVLEHFHGPGSSYGLDILISRKIVCKFSGSKVSYVQ